jgi:signal transduction histidine kinase
MRHSLHLAAALAVVLATPALAGAPAKKGEFGTAEEAKALVGKAIDHIKKAGPEQAYRDFTNKDPAFVDRDLYVIVYDMTGHVLAHGQNAKMVGKDNLDMRDADGKPYIRERIEAAKVQPTAWQDYKWTDPITRKLLMKSTYTRRHNDTLVSVGIYKR